MINSNEPRINLTGDLRSNLMTRLKEPLITCRFRPDLLLILTILWCHFIYNSSPNLRKPFAYLVLFGFILALRFLYRNFHYTILIRKLDALTWGAFLGILLLFHFPYLFHSLGGDELYHSERASFLLMNLSEKIKTLPLFSRDEFLQSMWNVFDFRHLPVTDIWRVTSFPILLAAGLLFLGCRHLRSLAEPSKILVLLAFCFGAAWYGYTSALGPDTHPPFRLFPLFTSNLIFGYNAFAFRIPGLLLVATVCLLIFRLLKEDSLWAGFIAITTAFLPVVFYVTNAVEPSVYGYAIWTSVLLLGWLYLQPGLQSENPVKDSRLLVIAATLVGIGAITRQTTVALWAWIGLLYWFAPDRKRALFFAQVFLPFLVAVPYFHHFKHSNSAHFHSNEGSLLYKILLSFQSGIGPMAILNSTTLPWVLFFILIGFGLAITSLEKRGFFSRLGLRSQNNPEMRTSITGRTKDLLPYLMIFPVYVTFHSNWSYLWGIGRYQAEYIAPFLVLTLFYLGRGISSLRWRVMMSFFLFCLCGVTLEDIAHQSWDINYAQWPRMRITTTANFPYTEALEDLHRREVQGQFALIGGQPWYGDAILWLSGHSFAETHRWRQHQNQTDALLNTLTDSGSDTHRFFQYLEESGIQFLVVQDGTRRELQHGSTQTHIVKRWLEREALQRDHFPRVSLFKQWGPEQGGSLKVYQVNSEH
jgi:hypothetical protein